MMVGGSANRKRLKVAMLTVVCLVLPMALPVADSALLGAPRRTLTIMVNAFYQPSVEELIVKPFEKTFGASVAIIAGNSTDMLARIRAEKANPSVDLIWIDGGPALTGIAEGLFDKIDPSKLTNWQDLADSAKDPDGYGPTSGWVVVVPIYDAKRVKPIPKSWSDLWNPAYRGLIGLPDIVTSQGLEFLVMAAKLGGGGENDIEAGFRKMAELKPNIALITKAGETFPGLLNRGEIALFLGNLSQAVSLKQQSGGSVDFYVPQEGAFPLSKTWQLVRNSSNRDLAYKFLDLVLGPEPQKFWAENYYLAPSNKKVSLSPEVAAIVPTAERLVAFDWVTIERHRADWVDRWNREVLR